MKFFSSPAKVIALLFAAGILLYIPVLQAPFIFDDYEFIVNHPLVHGFDYLQGHPDEAGLKWVTYVTFALNFAVGGQNPWGYHAVNILLHIFNACFLFFLARLILRTTKITDQFSDEQKTLISFVSAGIFLVHPVATSAVGYVWQRAELLTALFYLSSVIFYIKARQDKKYFYFFVAGVLFIIGIFAKGTIVSLPLVLILLECSLWPLSRKKALIIFLPLCGVHFFRSYMSLWQSSSDLYGQWFIWPWINFTGMILSPEFVWTQFFVTVKYLGLALFPFNQNFDYDIPLADSPLEPRVFLSVIVLTGTVILALKLWNTRRLFSVGVFWFLLCLAPAAFIGGREPMWEYRMYLPLSGFTLGVVALAFASFDKRKATIGFLIIGILFSGLTLYRNLLWRSPEFLLLDNIKKSPDKPNPYQLLGALYLQQGRLDAAQTMLEKTISLAPDAAESYNNLGLIAKYRGDFKKAQENFETAIKIRPTLGGAYVNLGYLLLKDGDDKKAEEILRQGLAYGETEGLDTCLAKVYLARHQDDAAEALLKKALSINPQASQTYFVYGELYVSRHENQKATDMFRKAVLIKPSLGAMVPPEFR